MIIPPIGMETPAFARDPEDDCLLAYALIDEADCLVTGDEDLLVLEQVADPRIASSRSLLGIRESED